MYCRTEHPDRSTFETEAVFTKAAAKPAAPALAPAIPGARQSVTLRVDEDVLEYFQADGPGCGAARPHATSGRITQRMQDRMTSALRAAAGL